MNRNRFTEDSIIQAWDAADVTPEVGQTTTVTLTDLAGNVLHAYTAIAGTSQDVDPADFAGEAEGYIVVSSERDGLDSLQSYRVHVRLVGTPVNTVLPVISGDPVVGETLSTTDGTWTDGGSTISGYTYQWLADDVAIDGATASTFLLTDTQIGAVITCTVTATNAGGSTSATSEGTDEVAAAATDPNFASVVLLSQFTGANGSTAFTDQSGSAHTLTPLGDAQIQSNKLELDGTTDGISIPDSADWQWNGAGTLEIFGVVFDDKSVSRIFANHYNNSSNQRNFQFYWNQGTTRLHFGLSSNGSTVPLVVNAAFNPTVGQRYDICIERTGASTWRIYVDGISLTLVDNSNPTQNSFNSTEPLYLGQNNTGGASFDGRWEAIRWTNGVARYSGNYTVPILPLPTS